MFKGLRISSNKITGTIVALENKIRKILFDISMNFIEFNSIIPLAFFRAAFMFRSPWIDASWTEKWTTWTTFLAINYNHSTNCAHEVISTFSFIFITFNQICDIKIALMLFNSLKSLRLICKSIWISLFKFSYSLSYSIIWIRFRLLFFFLS